MLFVIINIYVRVQEFLHDTFHYNLPGFGFLLNKIKKDRVLMVKGQKLYLNHQIADNYLRLVGGRYNEPETHTFLHNVIKQLSGKVNFADIGANVGEFILDMANHPKVNHVWGFEPQTEQFVGLTKTVEINSFKHVTLVNKPVSDSEKEIIFYFDPKNRTASGITNEEKTGTQKFISTYLDKELTDYTVPNILLIDVEGSECEVMRGGMKLITENKPLIIFEYNHVSKQHFTIDDVQGILGAAYEIYRLRNDGNIDKNFDRTWNLVAVNKTSVFYTPVISLKK